jgi:TonB family protein
MRLGKTVVALVLLVASACVSSQGDTPDNPIRIVRPTREEIMREYPPDALAQRITGRATVECEVTANGMLDQCLVMDEEPIGHGFGDAAIRVAFEHYARPDAEGRYRVGRRVRVPIDFTLPR